MNKNILGNLKSKDLIIKNKSAIDFIDFIEDWKWILKKEIEKNSNNNGTLVYAMWFTNCSDDFLFLFKLLILDNYEAFTCSYNILNEQKFNISIEDKNKSIRILKSFKEEWFSEEDYNERKRAMLSIINKIK